MSTTADKVWAVGRPTIGTAVKVAGRMKVYGKERVPLTGGLVIACNHFSWIDPPALGASCPRTIYFMAKVEAHRVPGLGQLMRSFGAFSVRRGESDRDAVRTMREIVRNGHALRTLVGKDAHQALGQVGTDDSQIVIATAFALGKADARVARLLFDQLLHALEEIVALEPAIAREHARETAHGAAVE